MYGVDYWGVVGRTFFGDLIDWCVCVCNWVVWSEELNNVKETRLTDLIRSFCSNERCVIAFIQILLFFFFLLSYLVYLSYLVLFQPSSLYPQNKEPSISYSFDSQIYPSSSDLVRLENKEVYQVWWMSLRFPPKFFFIFEQPSFTMSFKRQSVSKRHYKGWM